MWDILPIILKRKKYVTITVTTALLMSGLSYYLTIINVFHKSILIYAEMNGLLFTIASIILTLIIAILFGFYIALLIFRRDLVKTRARGNKITSFSGAAAGILASGCPSCGVPLLGLIGLPLGLFALPLKGLEIKLLSLSLLGFSLYLISKNIKKNLTCRLKPAQYI